MVRDFAFIGLNQDVYRSGETLEGVVTIICQGQNHTTLPDQFNLSGSGSGSGTSGLRSNSMSYSRSTSEIVENTLVDTPTLSVPNSYTNNNLDSSSSSTSAVTSPYSSNANIYQPTTLTHSVEVRVCGREVVCWHDYIPTDDITETKKVTASRVFYNETVRIWSRNDEHLMDPLGSLGTNSYKFSIKLPTKLPGSFHHAFQSYAQSHQNSQGSAFSPTSFNLSSQPLPPLYLDPSIASTTMELRQSPSHSHLDFSLSLTSSSSSSSSSSSTNNSNNNNNNTSNADRKPSMWVIPNGGLIPKRIDPSSTIEYAVFVMVYSAELSSRKLILQHRANFRVVENISADILYREPSTYSAQKTFLFGGKFPAILSATVKPVHFLDAPIPFHISVSNGSNRSISGIVVTLYQCIHYQANDTQALDQELILANFNVPNSDMDGPGNRAYDVAIRVPDSQHWLSGGDTCGTILFGKLLKVTYKVVVKLIVPNAIDLDLRFPIHLVQRTPGITSLKDCLHDPIPKYSTSDILDTSDLEREERRNSLSRSSANGNNNHINNNINNNTNDNSHIHNNSDVNHNNDSEPRSRNSSIGTRPKGTNSTIISPAQALNGIINVGNEVSE